LPTSLTMSSRPTCRPFGTSASRSTRSTKTGSTRSITGSLASMMNRPLRFLRAITLALLPAANAGNCVGSTALVPVSVINYHADHLGSATLLTDGNGQTLQRASFSPFGEIAALTDANGHAVADPKTSPTPYLFTGQEYDWESSLHYFRARYLNPRT